MYMHTPTCSALHRYFPCLSSGPKETLGPGRGSSAKLCLSSKVRSLFYASTAFRLEIPGGDPRDRARTLSKKKGSRGGGGQTTQSLEQHKVLLLLHRRRGGSVRLFPMFVRLGTHKIRYVLEVWGEVWGQKAAGWFNVLHLLSSAALWVLPVQSVSTAV